MGLRTGVLAESKISQVSQSARAILITLHFKDFGLLNSSQGSGAERVGNFLGGLASRGDEVKRRCRTVLQSRAIGSRKSSGPIPKNLKMHIPPWL